MSGVLDKLTILEMKIGRVLDLLVKEKRRVSDLMKENTELRENSVSATAFSSEINALRETCALLEGQIQSERDERSRWEIEKKDLTGKYEVLEQDHALLKEELANHTVQDHSEITEENVILKDQIAFEKEKYGKLHIECDKLRKELEDSRRPVSEIKERVELVLKELEDIPDDDEDDSTMDSEDVSEIEDMEGTDSGLEEEQEIDDGSTGKDAGAEEEEIEIEEELPDDRLDGTPDDVDPIPPTVELEDEWKEMDEVEETPEGDSLDEGATEDVEKEEEKEEEKDEKVTALGMSEDSVRKAEPKVKIIKKRIIPDEDADVLLFNFDDNGNETDMNPAKIKKNSKDDLI